MDEETAEPKTKLTRQEISAAITGLGWRFILGAAGTHVRVGSLAQGASVAGHIIDAAGAGADESLRVDIRRDHVILTLQSLRSGWVSRREVELAGRISAAVRELGLNSDPDVSGDGASSASGDGAGTVRSAQILEIAIDAMDIAAIRPFWQAVLGYGDEPGKSGPEDALVDPAWESPAIWFQQMDAPRPQRNRIHFDVSVPHDEAQHRIRAALAAGGRLLYDAEAPAFWVLADAEGNEACVTTWQGRDPVALH
ncbi:MAG: 4a-hydroxytetrahydrobiopterin dehydratase [Actinomycetota bacterium]|nr:4a-hydroxytetrahydrobiopterin dehydratase [Actinomycetota bacterium]